MPPPPMRILWPGRGEIEMDYSENNLYDPQAQSRLTIQAVETERKAAKDKSGIRTGHEAVDAKMNPLRGAQVVPVLGYTSNYKSGWMSIIAGNAEKQLSEDECIIACNWEDSVEDAGIWRLAGMTNISPTQIERGELNDSEWKRMLKSAVDMGKSNLYWMGHSDQMLRRRPRMTVGEVWKSTEFLVSELGKKPRLMIIDYLQRINPGGGSGHRIKMMGMVDQIKDMSIAFNVPILLGTQASRESQTQGGLKIPKLWHSQETSNIEQSATGFWICYMPIKTEAEGSTININGRSFSVTRNLLIVTLAKQKRGPAPVLFAFDIDFRSNQLKSLDPVVR